MKKEIENRSDIKKLVATFYERLLQEQSFKHLFFDVAEVDILSHLDLLVDFWESTLFQSGKYKRDMLEVHLDLHQKHRLKDGYFIRWLHVFNATVDDLFTGELATEAKARAGSLVTVIKMKINGLERWKLELNN